MRLILAVLILAAAPSVHAASKITKCKHRCDSNYDFCMNRAITKQAKKSCKADHKACRVTCK